MHEMKFVIFLRPNGRKFPAIMHTEDDGLFAKYNELVAAGVELAFEVHRDEDAVSLTAKSGTKTYASLLYEEDGDIDRVIEEAHQVLVEEAPPTHQM